ncbi:hypothetical protein RHS01_03508 [Rhizoctonia solani]|uniref:Anoctamin transmembrane domain-containing protein n=1 Tax=Rhizoctonia solani TaxID=456999 RepID=A0A8H7IFF3_9AGAM|nr:hypothetical protein RHS01_03508 [Rhizoctonia solani]
MTPRVDLAIIFRSGAKSKAEAIDAASEYKRLLTTLTDGGLKAVGKKEQLAEHERRTDFVYGVARAKVLPIQYRQSWGVAPGSPHWSRIQSIMALQDRDFNHTWLSNWTRKQVGFSIPDVELDKIRDNFGESLALYFSFLSFYTRALFVPATLGLIAWREESSLSLPRFKNNPKIISRPILTHFSLVETRIPYGTFGSVISLFGVLLGGLLTAIFLFEAFVTQLYDGPGKSYIGFIPTIIFVTVILESWTINFFLETGLPFILREWLKLAPAEASTIKEQRKVGRRDQLVEHAREESMLPEYTLFSDYAEMVTQFGYIVIWSAAWPLAPLMALLNNWLELRSDAFKITSHGRRPLPQRVDTIGPWLEALGFITWVGALTNAALVYLFRP